MFKNIILFILIDLYLFFFVYVASMNVIRAHAEKRLNGILWVLCTPIVLLGYIYDIIHNLSLFTLIFFEFPRQLTVTQRLKRHIKEQTLRGKLARFVCDKILSPFDFTGNHCD